MLDRIEGIRGIEWAGAFSAASDAVNSSVPDGPRVAVRYVHSNDLGRLGVTPARSSLDGAWASPIALTRLGLPDSVGGITLDSGPSTAVVGRLSVLSEIRDLEPLVVIPRSDSNGPIAVLIVVATSAEMVVPVSRAVMSVIAPDDPAQVSVTTSETLATLRGIVEGSLGSFSHGLVLGLLGVMGTLVALLLYGLVMMRRKDFGRRRALGATRQMIVQLLLIQTAVLALIGTGIGVPAGLAVLTATNDPLPGSLFVIALAVVTVTTAVIAATVPAVVASRREPLRELRMP